MEAEKETKSSIQVIARMIAGPWNANGNCGLVVGATYPEEMKIVREVAPDMPILVPGIGAQNGNVVRSVAAGKNTKGQGLIIAATRAIIFASSGKDFADAARKKAEELNGEIMDALVQ